VPHTKFVIYSYNFGNFRNELAGIESWMAALTHFGIDAYFFTDDPDFNLQLDSWTIVYVPTREEENGIPGTRLSGKDIKFKGHPLLDPYDYHIYVDAAHLRMHKMSKWLASGLLHHVLQHPEKGLFISRHSRRDSVFEEMDRIRELQYAVNPKESLDAWEEFLTPQANELKKYPLLYAGIPTVVRGPFHPQHPPKGVCSGAEFTS
jgi:hypothetical protein